MLMAQFGFKIWWQVGLFFFFKRDLCCCMTEAHTQVSLWMCWYVHKLSPLTAAPLSPPSLF